MKIAASSKGIVSQLGKVWETENEARWLRAGLVFALTDIMLDAKEINSRAHAFIGITKLGIRGLGSATAVRSYHEVWEKAIEVGIVSHVTTGSELKAPSDTFDKYWQSTPHAKAQARKARDKAEAKASVDRAETPAHGVAPQTPRAKTMQAIENLRAAKSFAESAYRALEGADVDEEARRELSRTVRLAQQALLRVSESLDAELLAA